MDEGYATWLIGGINDGPETTWGIQYWKIAQKMREAIYTIKNPKKSAETKLTAANSIREQLQKCILDEKLDDLTSIYRYKKADNIIGYDLQSISEFVKRMSEKYPRPKIEK